MIDKQGMNGLILLAVVLYVADKMSEVSDMLTVTQLPYIRKIWR